MKAEYIDHMGDDLRVANAARVSMNKETDYRVEYDPNDPTCPPQVGVWDKDIKLINFLSRENHFTPFTHCVVTMRETVPIFVARQRFKHTVGFSYNEVSRRYVDDDPEFFIPKEWRGRPDKSIKQGSGGNIERQNLAKDLYALHVASALADYKELLNLGVAPEQARMVLPQSMYTSYYVTGSLAAWARAYKLRSDPHAQKEIQDLAKQWDEIVNPLFPYAWKALTDG